MDEAADLGIFFEAEGSSFGEEEFVGCAFGDADDVGHQLARDGRFVGRRSVAFQQTAQLQRIQFETGRCYVGQLLGRRFGRLQQMRRLHHSSQVTVGGQFQSLTFGPGFETSQTLREAQSPLARAQIAADAAGHVSRRQTGRFDADQSVENGRVQGVKKLRKELDRQRSVDSAPAQQAHRR